MTESSFGSTLVRAIVAGVIAAVVVSALHLVATEPLIEQAIALEEQMHASDEAPIVGRDVQRVGLVVGFLLYGVTWAMLFAVVYHLTQRWLPASTSARRGLILALVAYWAVGLFPFLKYPANPPAVGDPETIAYRQALYVGLLVLSIAGAAVALALARWLSQRSGSGFRPFLGAIAFLVIFAAVVYFVMPGNPDEVTLPADLMAGFRYLSLIGLTLFWAVLGVTFAALNRKTAESRPATA
jgi:predicted cobalt transporter CbtA